ncbi:MAG: HEAT repeat domain-containing protein [Blastocatellia bacterium]|nr:HEAT repeat domain-containing protein [Blastocatellia bacterium]
MSTTNQDFTSFFRFIHLSDIHFGYGDEERRYSLHLQLTDLITSLKKEVKELKIDALLVTGDIAFSGQVHQYEEATKQLKNIASSIGLEERSIFLVPGNHDVDRNVANKDTRRMLKALREEAEPIDNSLTDEDLEKLKNRMHNYLEFSKDFAPFVIEGVEGTLYWQHRYPTSKGLKVRLVGLNTALLCQDNKDKGKLQVGNKQISETLSEVTDNEIVIIMTHHPLDQIDDGYWIIDSREILPRLNQNAQLHLCGHIHQANISRTVSGGGQDIVRIIAGATHGEKREIYSYNICEIGMNEEGKLCVRTRPYFYSKSNADFRLDSENIPSGSTFSEMVLNKQPKSIEGTNTSNPEKADSSSINQNINTNAQKETDFDLESYRKALLQRYRSLDFDSFDTKGAYYRNSVALWDVFVAQTVRDCQQYYPQILELPKEHLKRMGEEGELDEAFLRKYQDEEERRLSYANQSPQSVLEVIGERLDRAVILGDPGSGKSSLLKYIALNWAKTEDINLLYSQRVPLLIELREYDRWECSEGKSFVKYLNSAQTFHRLNQIDLDLFLKSKDAVVLLDGLDEVFDQGRREQVVNDIQRLSNDYQSVKIIVTSRVIGYKQQRLSDIGFKHFMLQDLDRQQIEEFLNLWHDTTFDDESEKAFKKDRLRKAIDESKAIRELAGNPLLLTMMAILNRNQELPRDRGQLYEQASCVLLERWDTERKLGEHPEWPNLKYLITHKEKSEMLCKVATHMQSAPKGLSGNIISSKDLKEILYSYLKTSLDVESEQAHKLARLLIEQLRERNFILCYLRADSYAFVHRTFLEYFCAISIMEKFSQQEISIESLKEDVFGKHWEDETWHEVLCLITSKLNSKNATQVINYLLDQEEKGRDKSYEFHNIFLAARCFQELPNPKTFSELRKRLANELLKLMRFDFPYYYEVYESERQRKVKINTKAVSFIANFQLIDDTRLWLKDKAVNDSDSFVRETAISELARWWKDEPHTLVFIKDKALNDSYSDVRVTAISELARGWKDEPHTLVFIKDRALNDSDSFVRKTAIEELARGWKDEPDTLVFIKDRAVNESDNNVQATAIIQLASEWKDQPDTLIFIKDRAVNESDILVRRTAIEELARGWRNDPDVQEFLRSINS